MKLSLGKTATRSIVGLTLAAGGFAATAGMVPVAHADTPPAISAQLTTYPKSYWYPPALTVKVTGSGFTPGGPVRVIVYNMQYGYFGLWPTELGETTVTSSAWTIRNCSPFGDGCTYTYAGSIVANMGFYGECTNNQTYYVIARDITTGVASNVVTQAYGPSAC